jgi:hypothetical protein
LQPTVLASSILRRRILRPPACGRTTCMGHTAPTYFVTGRTRAPPQAERRTKFSFVHLASLISRVSSISRVYLWSQGVEAQTRSI